MRSEVPGIPLGTAFSGQPIDGLEVNNVPNSLKLAFRGMHRMVEGVQLDTVLTSISA